MFFCGRPSFCFLLAHKLLFARPFGSRPRPDLSPPFSCSSFSLSRTALREKFEAEQAAGVLKNERLSLILATYQRNLEVTEKKLVASQQENIDLHIQIKQLVQNSSKLQHQLKEASASSGNLKNALDPESQVERSDSQAAIGPGAVAAQQAQVQAQVAEQQAQYMTMYAALTEQIKELKDHMRLAAIAPVGAAKEKSGSNSVTGACVWIFAVLCFILW